MATIKVDPSKPGQLCLGRRGESGIRTFQFDISSLVETIGPGGDLTLLLRADEDPDFTETPLAHDNSSAIWTVTRAATLEAGAGGMQLRYVNGARSAASKAA